MIGSVCLDSGSASFVAVAADTRASVEVGVDSATATEARQPKLACVHAETQTLSLQFPASTTASAFHSIGTHLVTLLLLLFFGSPFCHCHLQLTLSSPLFFHFQLCHLTSPHHTVFQWRSAAHRFHYCGKFLFFLTKFSTLQRATLILPTFSTRSLANLFTPSQTKLQSQLK